MTPISYPPNLHNAYVIKYKERTLAAMESTNVL
jgi:hypothetical protein